MLNYNLKIMFIRKYNLFFVIFIIFLSAILCSCEKDDNNYVPEEIIDSTGLMGMLNSPWPCDGHDSRRSSQSTYNGPDQATVIWTYNASPGYHIEDAISPVIDDDGNLYSMNWTRMIKLSINGSLLWSADMGYYLRTMPTLGSDETIYATGMYQMSVTGFTQGGIIAVDPEGNEKWEFETEDQYDGGVNGAATIAPDGTIYIADGGGYLYALSPEGGLRWKYNTDRSTASSPALMVDGTILIVDYLNTIYAIKPDGSLKWQRQLTVNISYDMALDIDGTIYIGSEIGILALTAAGDDLWNYTVTDGAWSRPAVGSDHTIVFGGRDGYIYALNPDGTEKWKYQTGNVVASTPTIDARGHVYIGSWDGYLYALTENGELKWKYDLNIGYGQPTIGADGTLYVGTQDGLIIAFKD